MKSSIEKLYEWSKDRLLVTDELHSSNDFYGHATILKKYAQIQPEYQIKAAIEHGPFEKNKGVRPSFLTNSMVKGYKIRYHISCI